MTQHYIFQLFFSFFFIYSHFFPCCPADKGEFFKKRLSKNLEKKENLVLEIFPGFVFLYLWANLACHLLCLCRSLCDIQQHRGTRYFRVCLHKDTGKYTLFPCRMTFLFLLWFKVSTDHNCPTCFMAAVVWEAGFPCRHASGFIQPAVSSGERRTHQPPGCGWLRPSSLHAHPGTAPTTPLSDPASPPAAGWTGSVDDSIDACVSTSTGSAVSDSCDDVHLVPTRTYSSDLYVYKLLL